MKDHVDTSNKLNIIEIIAYIAILTFGIYCFNHFTDDKYKPRQGKTNVVAISNGLKAYDSADYYIQISNHEVIVTNEDNKVMFVFDSTSQIFKTLEKDNE